MGVFDLEKLSLPTIQPLICKERFPFFGDITIIDGKDGMPDVEINYLNEDELAVKYLELD